MSAGHLLAAPDQFRGSAGGLGGGLAALGAGSFHGKVVGGVLEVAARYGVPVLVVAGDVDPSVRGRAPSVSLLEEFGVEASWGEPLPCVTRAVRRHLPERPATW